MNSGSKLTKLFAAAIFLLILAYFGIYIVRYYRDPLTTTVTYYYATEEHTSLNGYMVRQETVLGSVDGILTLSRSEGEKVGVGQTIAVSYSNQDARETETQLQQLEMRLAQLQYAQEVSASADVALRLDSTILDSIWQVQETVASGNLGNLSGEALNLKTLIMKRDYSPDGEDLKSQIKDLNSQISTLKKSLKSSSRNITASASGTYSAVVDGYETVLTPAFLAELTPSALLTVQADESVSSNVGKLISGTTWYYAAVIDSKNATRFTPGSSVKLRFAKNAQRDYTMTVTHLSEEENGRQVLVLSCSKYLAELTLLRQPTAEVIHKSHTGLRVPTKALRMNEDGVLGVYCRIGMVARFKPVEQVFAGEDFYLVKAAEGASRELTLREGDEIIVTANSLYDGKVVG